MKKIFCILGIIVGIAMIVIGVNAAGYSVGNTYEMPLDYTFGADYYTEQYGATRDAALNSAYLGYALQGALTFGIAFLGKALAALGAAVICLFGYKLGKCFDGTESTAVPAPVAEPVSETAENAEVPAVDYVPDRVEETKADPEPEAPAEEPVSEIAEEAAEPAEEAVEEAAEPVQEAEEKVEE